MLNNKIWLAIIIILVLIAVFYYLNTTKASLDINSDRQTEISQEENNNPQIISTKPDPLEGSIVSATEQIEITFNRPLENEGEFKLKIEPEVLYKIELSQDRQTAKIIPVKPYELGRTYTLFIKGDTKFDGVGQWGKEKIFHVNTVRYRGL